MGKKGNNNKGGAAADNKKHPKTQDHEAVESD